MTDLDRLIDDLAAEASPVRSHSTLRGRSLLIVVAMATLAAMYGLYGFRGDVLGLNPSPVLSIAAGLMLILGIAAGLGAVRMARPQVGAPASPAPWLLAALLLLPLTVLLQLATGASRMSELALDTGLSCMTCGVVAGIATSLFLFIWLKQGAPVAPERAAWLVGLAGGAVGALAVTLECPVDSVAHLGVWHVAAVPLSAVAARVVLPRLLRW